MILYKRTNRRRIRGYAKRCVGLCSPGRVPCLCDLWSGWAAKHLSQRWLGPPRRVGGVRPGGSAHQLLTERFQRFAIHLCVGEGEYFARARLERVNIGIHDRPLDFEHAGRVHREFGESEPE